MWKWRTSVAAAGPDIEDWRPIDQSDVGPASDICRGDSRFDIIRNKKEMECPVKTVEARGSTRMGWSFGTRSEMPSLQVFFIMWEKYNETYIYSVQEASPADTVGLQAGYFITNVKCVATKTLDEVIEEVRKLPDNKYCRIGIVDNDGKRDNKTVIPNAFFPCENPQPSERQPFQWSFTRYPSHVSIKVIEA